MRRRDFVLTAIGASLAKTPLVVPIRRIIDIRAKDTFDELNHFWWDIWPEAVRDLGRCGIQFRTTDAQGEIRLTAGERPIFIGLERGVINLVLTDHIPVDWDRGRALAGVSTFEEGYALCAIAIANAHCHRVPFLSVNTCVHELLHVLLGDIFFASRPKWYQVDEREARINWYATRLWLFHDGATIRESAQACLGRLRRVEQPFAPRS
jgi:hypothetical protein